MNRAMPWLRSSYLVVLALLVFWATWPVNPADAHGGSIIANDFTTDYEWLVAINPYPVTLGATVITLLVYDTQTFGPVTDMQVELYLAPPNRSTPCCEPGVHLGPLRLETNPDLFPGDYSTTIDINQAGEWQAKFIGKHQRAPLEVTIPFVALGDLGLAPATATFADPSETATAFAENVAAARQTPLPLSPLGQPVSPISQVAPAQAARSPLSAPLGNTAAATSPLLVGGSNATLSRASSPFGDRWWLWGLVALAPVVLIFRWALRPYEEREL
jgi:hypothetical protein